MTANPSAVRSRILVVDDQPANIQLLHRILKQEYDVSMATGGLQALEFCRRKLPDLILLDVLMPDLDGYEVCTRLKADPATRAVPVIFVTARDSVEDETRGLEAGAVDFLTKPVNMPVVLARVRAQLALKRQAESRIEELIANIPGAFFRCPRPDTGRFDFLSEQFAEITGYPAGDFSGEAATRRFHELVHADDRSRLAELAGHGEGRVYQLDYRVLHRDGTLRWVHERGRLIVDDTGRVVCREGALFDITERKLREEETRLARLEAERANRSKSEFLACMTHEFRTPMNAILGFAEMLMRQIDDPRQREYLLSIRQSSLALLTLVNDILDLSKAEAGRFDLRYGAVRLRELIDELATLFRLKLTEKGVGFAVEVAPNVPQVLRLDAVRLRQVLLNLLGNAAKFTAAGAVRLQVACYAWEGTACGLEFAVCDSGIGIPGDKLALIFDPFEQIDRGEEFGGTGLGLAISRRLVGLMGGEIGVDSREGEGSRFTVRLPQVDVLPDAAEALQEPPAAPDSPNADADFTGLGLADPASPAAGGAGLAPFPAGAAAQDLLRMLVGAPTRQWQSLTDAAALDIGALIRFGTELEALGREHGWQDLAGYGDRLKSQAAQFDLAALPETLKTFPRLLNRLKNP